VPTVTPTATDEPTATPTPTSQPPGPAPVLTSIQPNNGPNNEITWVFLFGANFVATPVVTLGDVTLTDVSLVNASQLLGAVPAGITPGTYDVRACNPDSQCATLPAGFTVAGSGPTLLNLLPGQGYTDIPNDLTIFGFNFQDGVIFTIGATPLENVVWVNATQARAVVPADIAPGTYDVTARNPSSPEMSTLAAAYIALNPVGDDFFATADDLWTSPSTVRQGDIVMLGLNIHRQGGESTLQPTIAFYLGDPAAGGTLIGQTQALPMPPGADVVEPVSVDWNTAGLADAVEVYAVIDPEGLLAETTKANNVARRTLTILPPAPDTTPPQITSLIVNGGAPSTDNATISIAIEAVDLARLMIDTGGSGVNSMLLVEREFNSSARQWVAVQQTGWIPFQSPYAMTLTSRGGVRYIQAWVADRAGNISEATFKTRIDYMPPSETIRAGQVRLYRRDLALNEVVTVHLETMRGDADLYVWAPDGSRSWVSNKEGLEDDEVSLVAPQAGTYQIEVYGYQESDYRLTVTIGGTAVAGAAEVTHVNAAKPARTQPIIALTNEPAGNSAVPVAPISSQQRVYLPLVLR
jgi:hypothetical protein